MAIEETVIGHRFDPDFGALSFVETRTMAAVDGGPMKPLVYRSWRGKIFGLDAEIQISCEEDPPVIAEDIRTSFRGVVANVGNFTKRVARRELDLAKQWAQEGELDLVLDELSFADLLKIKAFSIDPGRLTVWLQEAANIFAGHDLEVRIEDGVIAEICLAG